MDFEIRFYNGSSRIGDWTWRNMEVSFISLGKAGRSILLIFILFTVLIGLPLLIAEFMIGRSTQKQAVGAFKSIAPNTGWHWIGRLGVGTCFILLSFYSVVGGWVLIYLFRGVTGQLITPGQNYGSLFTETIGNPVWAIMGHFAFMFITIWVVSKGVQNGIEKQVNICCQRCSFYLSLLLFAH